MSHLFRYPTRWVELNSDLPSEVLALLEERDITLEDYINKSISTGGNMMLVVATDGGPFEDIADYLTTGEQDEVEIQEAIDDLPSTGGTVFLTPGTYKIADSIDISGSKPITILGFGVEHTIIEVDTINAVSSTFNMIDGGTSQETFYMSGIQVNCNSQSRSGVHFASSSVTEVTITDCFILNSKASSGKAALYFDANTAGFTVIRGNRFRGNYQSLRIRGSGQGFQVINNEFEGVGGAPVGLAQIDAQQGNLSGTISLFAGNTMVSQTANAPVIHISGGTGPIQVSDNYIKTTHNSGRGIEVDGSYGIVSGNWFIHTSSSAGGAGLRVGGDQNLIIGNLVYSDAVDEWALGIDIEASADGTRVFANEFEGSFGTAAIQDNGSNTEFIQSTSLTDHGDLAGLSDDDHTQYVLRSILTTRGDLFRRGASAIERVALGSTNEVLTSDGTDAVWDAHSYEDFTTLTDDTASATGAWEAYGTESITITDPGRAVKIVAWLNCDIRFTGAGVDTEGRIRLQISTDGGATFTPQQDHGSFVGNGGTNPTDSPSSRGRVSATPTGNIVVKAELQQVAGTAGDVSFENGSIEVLVVPA